jgi:hypothetical protein
MICRNGRNKKNDGWKGFSLFVKALQEGIKDRSIRSDIDPIKSNLVFSFIHTECIQSSPTIKLHLENNNLNHD